MGRDMEVQNPRRINGYVEKEVSEAFKNIAIREFGGNVSKLIRKVIEEYVKAHGEGNSTFKITEWTKDPDFLPVPSLMSPVEKLKSYVEKEDITELKKVKEQHTIFGKMLDKRIDSLRSKDDEQTDQEKELAKQRRNDNFRRTNDIRYKDPKKLSWNQLQVYNRIMEREKENNQTERGLP
jgi:Holliday junction resolvasome RuvABC DNA-binding subunit